MSKDRAFDEAALLYGKTLSHVACVSKTMRVISSTKD